VREYIPIDYALCSDPHWFRSSCTRGNTFADQLWLRLQRYRCQDSWVDEQRI